MIVRKLRLRNGWSQEQLAEMTGLSVRTIQRIERGQPASLESQKALASVFEVDITTFQTSELTQDTQEPQTKEPEMNTDNHTEVKERPVEKVSNQEADAMEYVKGIKDFYGHLTFFVIFTLIFIFAGHISEMLLPWGGWALGVIFHGLQAFEITNIFNINWEKKMVEKRLKKKL